MTDLAIPLQAAIRVEKDRPVDDIFEAVAELLRAEGLVVAGFLQWERTDDGACCGRIELEDLASGERHQISQALGPGARGCRLDPQALAHVAGRLLSGLENDPDLLILNRFGKGEAEGQGFRAVMEEACARDIPVLIAVRESYVEAWERFAGDLGLLLPPDRGPVVDWVRRAVAAAGRLRDAA
ncbi:MULTISPECIES: DUF2478 domain-containing protein [Alphaproteobacteria]|jgi:nucleoside-triphosphatase THEP1|uniref:DUF2478 domain-containing protein n=2 Tax=Alphaproteobacteria TaxID=28211 RepID=A0A512HM62_9HYPH|nr:MULTISPECIES: DUF2478 domain-containing protein [Alphaproteobacteria]MBA3040982.1 DUF2478 domain-containing protein [Rhizobiaceae bacterium]MBU3962628.1 DUF2478 domain-containing protein [Alphaproteobacteria bacterium]GEO86534.1 hypothetical protein RNA01_34660 [Ciceribacter naphthalenivorans]GLR23662.1 hypothetical protein GCM10007920_34540 [Ciceribacter naphthalenivorans]GLT06518.1 hypothetical protein GCM10007926_34540 [Sphingomonas psychrolutea]